MSLITSLPTIRQGKKRDERKAADANVRGLAMFQKWLLS
jgi:hypothetical protein